MGNRAQLSRWQDEFHAHMSKAFPALQRGESALVTKRKHIPTWLFKKSIDLTRQQRAIEKAISEIGVLNAGKKRDEVLELVGPYFSRLEQHLGQMQKYQATIIPQYQIEAIARCIMSDILAFMRARRASGNLSNGRNGGKRKGGR